MKDQFFTSGNNTKYDQYSNNLLYRIKQNSLLPGLIIWAWVALNKALSLPSIVILRKRTGRCCYGMVSVLIFYFIILFMIELDEKITPAPVIDNPEYAQFTRPLDKIVYCGQSTKNAASHLLTPWPILRKDWVLGVFLFIVIALAIKNMAEEHTLVEAKKPAIDYRGDSYLMIMVNRPPDQFDFKGIVQRFIEPLIILILGLLASLFHYDIGLILTASAISLFFQEHYFFSRQSIYR